MSDCDVCIGGDFDFDGYPEFYVESWPKARKQHRCGECRCTINVGERYQSCSSKFDGEVHRDKTCAACAEIRTAYSCGEMSPCFGGLWQAFYEADAFRNLRMAGECWDSLSSLGKTKLLDKWRKWKGLNV